MDAHCKQYAMGLCLPQKTPRQRARFARASLEEV